MLGVMSFAILTGAIMGIVWLFECDMATIIARVGFRAFLWGPRDIPRGSKWPGATALQDLPRLRAYLSAKKRRIVILLLPPSFFLTAALYNVISAWRHIAE